MCWNGCGHTFYERTSALIPGGLSVETVVFGLIAVMGISMISTGLKLKQCFRSRSSNKQPQIKQAQFNQQAFFSQPLHIDRLGIAIMRIGVPVAHNVEFSIERKSVIERGPLFSLLSALGLSEKPLGLPLLDYLFKFRTKGWQIEHVLRVRPDVGHLLVMHLGQGALRGFSVRRVVCQRGILWIDIVQTRQQNNLVKNDVLDTLVPRWVPALTQISEAIEQVVHGSSETVRHLHRSSMLQRFKQRPLLPSSLLRNKSLRSCRLVRFCRSTPILVILMLTLMAVIVDLKPVEEGFAAQLFNSEAPSVWIAETY